MAAIAGIIHFDGAPVDPLDLQRMSQALQPFGRDGESIVRGDGYGLVVRKSHITPEDLLDQQPVKVRDRDMLIFEGRLDNRADLIRTLALDTRLARHLADSALAAKAWERWGKEACCKLIGYFTLAHWCFNDRRLTLVRSAPRGSALYVRRQGSGLYFASTPHALFALPQIPRMLNDSALADVLLGISSQGDTLFQGISQVLNAHWAVFGFGHERVQRYWEPDRPDQFKFKREEEAWEAFATLFDEVMRNHLRSIKPVGVTMSGGLDSAAVAGQAAKILAEAGKNLCGYIRIPIPGYSAPVKRLYYHDERPRVEVIAEMHQNLLPHYIHADEEFTLDNLRQQFPISYTVSSYYPTQVLGSKSLFRQAATDGTGVILHGTMGNFTFTYNGRTRLHDLGKSMRWFELTQELKALRRFNHGHGNITRELLSLLMSEKLKIRLRRYLKKIDNHEWRTNSAISSVLAERTGVIERYSETNKVIRNLGRQNSWQRRANQSMKTPYSSPTTTTLLAEFGLDYRDPSGDRRIIDFCLSLSDDYFFREGIPRRLARKGLKHLIPDVIAMDPTRGVQDVDWEMRLRRDSYSISQALKRFSKDSQIGDYLDLETMQRQWLLFLEKKTENNHTMRYCHQPFMGGLNVGLYYNWFENDTNHDFNYPSH